MPLFIDSQGSRSKRVIGIPRPPLHYRPLTAVHLVTFGPLP